MENEVVNSKEQDQEKAQNGNGVDETKSSDEKQESLKVEDEKKEEVDPTLVLEKELKEAKQKYVYLAAELDNTKKRFQKEKEQLLKFGSERILSDLLEVMDNLERTSLAIDKEEDAKIKNILVGVNMVKKQFIDTLCKHGLESLESLGQEFDPNVHEAMAQEESKEHESNTVISVFQQGYKLNGRLLRAAKVIVAK